jgi:hypothetical protein
MAALYYYFNNQTSFYYNYDAAKILGGDVVQITMPNNNNNQSVFSILDDNVMNYYTLNSLYIALSFSSEQGKYQLIIQGYKNDYSNNKSSQILLLLPIFNRSSQTINGTGNSITNLNNVYIDSILKNMEFEGTYNFKYGDMEDSVDMNKFLTNNTEAAYFTNIVDSNIKTNVIVFSKSNFYMALPKIPLLDTGLKTRIVTTKLTESGTPMKSITVESNGSKIISTTETDIYIDCSPTNNIGEKVDIYTSTDLDQLKFFQINDLKVWAFRFITFFVMLLIIFVIIKIFQITINGKTDNVNEPSK